MQDTLIILPTYNEKENIENIIRAIFSLEKDFDILVVDDNSPDGTGEIVKKMQSKFPDQIFLEIRKLKTGLGAAYIHGFKWALLKKYDYRVLGDSKMNSSIIGEALFGVIKMRIKGLPK